MLETNQWCHQYSPLNISGHLKTAPEDFQVTEILGYEATGEGEHIYLWIEKVGLNTAYLAEQIAKFCQLPLRAVSYAGRKDKHAITQQWFGVHCPGKANFDWDAFIEPGAKVIRAIRHNKKLRTGALKGNHFNITLRQLSSTQDLDERLQEIAELGVPNYFGTQRFGDTRYDVRGSNLVLAEKMLNGESIRNRNKRSMAISALRSWLFNQAVHSRIQMNKINQPLVGDIMQLAGSNSIFCAEEINEEIATRLDERDIYITAPLWGVGKLATQTAALQFETSLGKVHEFIAKGLENIGLKQERRAIQLFPQNMQWQILDDTLELEFSLPSGTFATSVVREIMNVVTPRNDEPNTFRRA